MTNQKLYRCSSPACDKDVKEEFIRKWPTADGRFRYLCVNCVEKRKTRKG